MRFDLFDAMRILKDNFGSESELLIQNHDETISVRLVVWQGETPINHQFEIAHREMHDSQVSSMNFRFNRGVREIKNFIDKAPSPHPHTDSES